MINAGKVDPIAAIHALTPRKGEFTILRTPVSGVDFAFDCIGIKKTMEQIVPACRSGQFGVHAGGTAVLVGVPGTPVELNAMDMLLNERHSSAASAGRARPIATFPIFLDWHKNGDLDLDAMVTARYRLEDINEATTALAAGKINGRAILEFEH